MTARETSRLRILGLTFFPATSGFLFSHFVITYSTFVAFPAGDPSPLLSLLLYPD